MITITNPIQLSVDNNARPIFVVAGANPAEFEMNVITLFGQDTYDAILAWADGQISKLAVGGEQAVVAAAFPGATAQAAPATVPAAAPQASEQQDGPWSETDKWNNKFTYGLPGAPVGPNGAKVLKEGVSKAGKAYKAWISPTQTPFAYRNGIAKDESEQIEWCR